MHICVLVCFHFFSWLSKFCLKFNVAVNIIAEHSFHIWHRDPTNSMKHMKIAIDHYVSTGAAGMIKDLVIDAVDEMIASSNNQFHGGSKDGPEVEHGDELVKLCDSIIQITVNNLLCKPYHSFLHIAWCSFCQRFSSHLVIFQGRNIYND